MSTPASTDYELMLRRLWESAASLPLAEAATLLDTTPDALRHRITRGACPLPFFRGNDRQYRFYAADIAAYLAKEDAT